MEEQNNVHNLTDEGNDAGFFDSDDIQSAAHSSTKNSTGLTSVNSADPPISESRQHSTDSDSKKLLTWVDFTVNFHSRTEPYESVKAICDSNLDVVVDLRPYMESRPYTCFEKDDF